MRELRLDQASFLVLAEELLQRGGSFEFRAGGSSMNPAIQNGDVVRVCGAVPECLSPGSIILYRDRHGYPVVHRVTKVLMDDPSPLYLVSGDAYDRNGERVAAEQVLGVVTAVKRESGAFHPVMSRNQARLPVRLARLVRRLQWAIMSVKRLRLPYR